MATIEVSRKELEFLSNLIIHNADRIPHNVWTLLPSLRDALLQTQGPEDGTLTVHEIDINHPDIEAELVERPPGRNLTHNIIVTGPVEMLEHIRHQHLVHITGVDYPPMTISTVAKVKKNGTWKIRLQGIVSFTQTATPWEDVPGFLDYDTVCNWLGVSYGRIPQEVFDRLDARRQAAEPVPQEEPPSPPPQEEEETDPTSIYDLLGSDLIDYESS